jgi:hypothetical protein
MMGKRLVSSMSFRCGRGNKRCILFVMCLGVYDFKACDACDEFMGLFDYR